MTLHPTAGRARFASLALLLACGRPAPEPASDPAMTRLVEAWTADPAAAARAVAALPPAERIVAIDVLTRAKPGETAALCALAPTPVATRRCQEVNRRPHLWEGPTRTRPTPVGERAAPGPRKATMPETPPLEPLWEDADPPACDATLRQACLEEAAQSAARAGSWAEAAGACAAMPEGRWRDECFFEAAEAGVLTHGAPAYPAAARLCQRSGDFAPNCQEHLLFGLRRGFTEAQAAIDAVWGEHERVRLYLVDHYWSDYAGGLLREAVPDPPGTPPVIATRHLRMELALVAVASAAPTDTLDSLAARVAEWEPTAWTRSYAALPNTQFLASLWPEDAAGEDTIPAMLVRARTRRAWSEDAAIDRRICVLEAAVVPVPPRADLLRDGLDEADVLVRWTAARLMGVVAPNDPALLALVTDADARIRARATGMLDPRYVGDLPETRMR